MTSLRKTDQLTDGDFRFMQAMIDKNQYIKNMCVKNDTDGLIKFVERVIAPRGIDKLSALMFMAGYSGMPYSITERFVNI